MTFPCFFLPDNNSAKRNRNLKMSVRANASVSCFVFRFLCLRWLKPINTPPVNSLPMIPPISLCRLINRACKSWQWQSRRCPIFPVIASPLLQCKAVCYVTWALNDCHFLFLWLRRKRIVSFFFYIIGLARLQIHTDRSSSDFAFCTSLQLLHVLTAYVRQPITIFGLFFSLLNAG